MGRRAERLLALGQMAQFRCLGRDCPDHCCHTWQILLDEASQRRLEEAAATCAELATRLSSALEPTRQPGWHASLRLEADGCCALFDEGLCSLQRDHGEGLLPGTCATYPRSVLHVGDRCELTGSLSCPEVARLCLTDERLELGPVDWDVLPEGCLVTREVPADGGPYDGHFDLIRSRILELLGLPGRALHERLGLVACLADRISASVARDTAAGAGERLADELRRLADPLRRTALAEALRALAVPADFGLYVAERALRASLRGRRSERYRELCAHVLASYGLASPKSSQSPDPDEDRSASGALQDAYRRRRDSMPVRRRLDIERYLTRYSTAYWIREPFTRSPDPRAHSRELLAQLALIKLLLLGHSELDRALEGGTPAKLEALTIEVVQLVSRNIDHDPAFSKEIQACFGPDARGELARQISLARL